MKFKEETKMKFTIAEWHMIQEVIREERDKMEEADREGQPIVLSKEDAGLFSETKVIRPGEVHIRYLILNDIVTKLTNEEM